MLTHYGFESGFDSHKIGFRVFTMLLTGSYRRNLDDKMRLALPKPLREALGFPHPISLFLAPGTDQSLAIYPLGVLEQIGTALGALSPAGKESRAFSRLFYAQAQPAEVDRNGRLRIPVELAKWADLVSEVVVVGVRDRIEVWDSVVWDRFLEQNQPVYDSLAEAVWNQAMG